MTRNWPSEVVIKEMGPRDGLQNEQAFISTDDKVAWINQLSDSGLSYIEVTSFVNPKWIPQLADAFEVSTRIKRKAGTTYGALVPNRRGLESALSANIDEISVFMSASETHNMRNINKTIAETFPVLGEVVKETSRVGKSTRGYVSTAFWCPYEGKMEIDQVVDVCQHLLDCGIEELSIGDTIGAATPIEVEKLLDRLLRIIPSHQLAMHFHDTRGMALANSLVALQYGITTFDSSVGGIGGCPYAPGASGNLATDDLHFMLEGMEIRTGIDSDALQQAALFIQAKLERPLPSRRLHAPNLVKRGEMRSG